MHTNTWLVIANAAQALIYRVKNRDYQLIQTLNHEESRLKSAELVADKPGRHKTRQTNQGEFIQASDPHKQERVFFAKELAKLLDLNRRQNHYDALILCAEPGFYGLLLQSLPKAAQDRIVQTVEKDYIPLPEQQRNKVIEAMLELP